MPRRNRQLYDGAIYHIISRGHNRLTLFSKKRDYIKFKTIVFQYEAKYRFKCFNYCFISNHLHLLIQIDKAKDLPHVMQGILQSYARYYRKEYHTTGYLFQGRYKSLLIEKDEYLLECARYIERNPLRANIVQYLSEYPWSSYNYYANGGKDDIISTNILYGTFGSTVEQKCKAYRVYVETTRPYETILSDKMTKNDKIVKIKV